MSWISRHEGETLPCPVRLHPLLWKVLNSRGVKTKSDVEKLFDYRLSGLKDPSVLSGMDRAVERLVEAYQNQDPIAIYADFDLDGTPALALLYEGLKKIGFSTIHCYQPNRIEEGYGLHIAALEKLKAKGVRLVVTVDVGITAVYAAQWAAENDLDLIITDHHLQAETLPDSLAIINPNLEHCESGLGHLCGTGVAFYLFLGVRRALREKNLLESDVDPKELLDCFAIGTITDLVPLVEENRTLVKHGLKQLSQTKRPGLKALLKALGLDGRELSSQDVAMRFAPKLNALSRMESSLRAIDVFLETEGERAAKMASEVIRINKMRVALQQTALQEAEQMLFEHDKTPPAVFLSSATFHQGVVGLVAVRLAESQGVPAFIGALNVEKGTITGSSRLPQGSSFHLVEILKSCEQYLVKFGGHACAAGFELKVEDKEAFSEKLLQYFEGKAAEQVNRYYDCAAEIVEIDESFLRGLDKLEPFGQGFEVARLCLKAVKVQEFRALKGGHGKLKVGPSRGMAREAVWFSHPDWVGEELIGQTVDLIVEPQWNFFAGKKTLQLMVADGVKKDV